MQALRRDANQKTESWKFFEPISIQTIVKLDVVGRGLRCIKEQGALASWPPVGSAMLRTEPAPDTAPIFVGVTGNLQNLLRKSTGKRANRYEKAKFDRQLMRLDRTDCWREEAHVRRFQASQYNRCETKVSDSLERRTT